jgi:hypothetical protein
VNPDDKLSRAASPADLPDSPAPAQASSHPDLPDPPLSPRDPDLPDPPLSPEDPDLPIPGDPEQPQPMDIGDPVDARDAPRLLAGNRERLGVDEDHQIPAMKKFHRGTFP